MRVLVAGATGAVGVPIVERLVAAGDDVTGLVRSPAGARLLQGLGADAVRADVLDLDGLLDAVRGRRYDAVVHELTALRRPPVRYSDMAATNTLRTTGTRHLLAVARTVGATRFVTQSIVFGYGYTDHGDRPLTEDSPFGRSDPGPVRPVLAALATAEGEVFADPAVEGVALRYGLFYGRDIATTARLVRRRLLPVPRSGGRLAMVHHDDAAEATVAALRRGRRDTAYNIVDDTPVTWRDYVEALASAVGAPPPVALPGPLLRALVPYAGLFMTRVDMTVSNARAAGELGWRPTYRSYRDGIEVAARQLRETGGASR